MSKKRTTAERSGEQETTEIRDLAPPEQTPAESERVVGGLDLSKYCTGGEHFDKAILTC
jgi:hypothetical protein